VEDERITAGAALKLLQILEIKARHVERDELRDSMLRDIAEAHGKLKRIQQIALKTEHDLREQGLI